ncbi:MAG: hypothetical protein EBZ69_06640 [Alphaproteobacteria bacterium]|nr:hypothetical protein [Alphaproteobacteria bacterium]NDC56470.1 hypothetical protein [Alphaproteobacteria bacterium]NDG04611.1 hypothetical protein [Alphaproteobacteria bacterium]
MAEYHDLRSVPTADETLDRLIAMTNQTNLVALDKTMAAIRRSNTGYAAAAARVGSIGERIVRAAHEVGLTLPPEQRLSERNRNSQLA